MPVKKEPNAGLNYGWDQGESGIHLQLDENWRSIGALLQLSVISSTVDVPASPQQGDRYIIPANATGVWTGHAGKVARRIGGSWEIYTPLPGWQAFDQSIEALRIFKDGAWEVDSAAGDMLAVNNLSDVTDPEAARNNLSAASIESVELTQSSLISIDDSTKNALEKRVRFDANQSLTTIEQNRARNNIRAASTESVNEFGAAMNTYSLNLQTAIVANTAAIDKRVRVDASQSFTAAEQTQARGNISAASAASVTTAQTAADNAQTAANTAQTAANTAQTTAAAAIPKSDKTKNAWDLTYGTNGGYTIGAGIKWGGQIWGMGQAWSDKPAGVEFTVDGNYGVAWLRTSHPSARVGEGMYIYQNGNLIQGIGGSGMASDYAACRVEPRVPNWQVVFSGSVSGLTGVTLDSAAAYSSMQLVWAWGTVTGRTFIFKPSVIGPSSQAVIYADGTRILQLELSNSVLIIRGFSTGNAIPDTNSPATITAILVDRAR